MNQPAGTNNSAQMAEHDHNVGRVLGRLKELGIAENTLVVWMSDNGPMYSMHPHGGYSLLRGEKGDTFEGGVRPPRPTTEPEPSPTHSATRRARRPNRHRRATSADHVRHPARRRATPKTSRGPQDRSRTKPERRTTHNLQPTRRALPGPKPPPVARRTADDQDPWLTSSPHESDGRGRRMPKAEIPDASSCLVLFYRAVGLVNAERGACPLARGRLPDGRGAGVELRRRAGDRGDLRQQRTTDSVRTESRR